MIILLSGKQGSGKTTLMQALMTTLMYGHGKKVYPVIFADTIYKIHDYALALLEQRAVKRDIVKDGKLLQLLGTEWGRAIDQDIWVKCLNGQMENILKETNSDPNDVIFLVSDCRFKNEFDGVDGFKVRLEADKETRKKRCSQWRDNDTHPSEIDLDEYAAQGKFDCYVDTTKSIEWCAKHIIDCMTDKRTYGNGYSSVYDKYYLRPVEENKHKGKVICRGSYALKTACGVCSKCRDEWNRLVTAR